MASRAIERPEGFMEDLIPGPSELPDDMSEVPLPYPMMIKYKGVFDLTGMYRLIAHWFKSRKYELHEGLYKAKPPELMVIWTAKRKSTGYFQDEVTMILHILDLEDIEVIRKGQKKRVSKGRFTLRLLTKVNADYKDMFGQRKWQTLLERKLMEFMNKYVLYKDYDFQHIDRLYYEVWQLHTEIKNFLDMTAKGNAY